jgi:hypothetical protein
MEQSIVKSKAYTDPWIYKRCDQMPIRSKHPLLTGQTHWALIPVQVNGWNPSQYHALIPLLIANNNANYERWLLVHSRNIMSLSKLIQIFVHVQASHSDFMLKS